MLEGIQREEERRREREKREREKKREEEREEERERESGDAPFEKKVFGTEGTCEQKRTFRFEAKEATTDDDPVGFDRVTHCVD